MELKTKRIFLLAFSAIMSWALASTVLADTADQKKQLEAQITACTKQDDEHTVAVKVQTRWPIILTPCPNQSPCAASEFYDLRYGANRVALQKSLCTNAYVLDYATPGSPTVVVPTVMPTRTPVP